MFKNALNVSPPVFSKCTCYFLTSVAWDITKRTSLPVLSTDRSEDNLSSHYISPCLLRQAHQFFVGLPKCQTEETSWGSSKYIECTVAVLSCLALSLKGGLSSFSGTQDFWTKFLMVMIFTHVNLPFLAGRRQHLAHSQLTVAPV